MENKTILFITLDRSGYYNCVHNELIKRFDSVDFYNIEDLKFKYKNIFQRTYSFFYKTFKKQKLKNYLKLQPIIKETENKHYDYIVMIRPDLFFDSQLEILKKKTDNFIAYYHDSINNIPRKKEVIRFFDKVYSYEKKDVGDYNLSFLSNFIYLEEKERQKKLPSFDAFTVMSMDYRLETLKKLAAYFKQEKRPYEFLVQSDKQTGNETIQFIKKRKNNKQVLNHIKNAKIIVDIHKYGIQDGLTFRVFESLFFEKKLITTNCDIKNYDFYNPNNIFILNHKDAIEIPDHFFKTSYEKIDPKIYEKYHYKNWIAQILDLK